MTDYPTNSCTNTLPFGAEIEGYVNHPFRVHKLLCPEFVCFLRSPGHLCLRVGVLFWLEYVNNPSKGRLSKNMNVLYGLYNMPGYCLFPASLRRIPGIIYVRSEILFALQLEEMLAVLP